MIWVQNVFFSLKLFILPLFGLGYLGWPQHITHLATLLVTKVSFEYLLLFLLCFHILYSSMAKSCAYVYFCVTMRAAGHEA